MPLLGVGFCRFLLPERGVSRIIAIEVVLPQHDGLLAREVVASLAQRLKRGIVSEKEVVCELFLY